MHRNFEDFWDEMPLDCDTQLGIIRTPSGERSIRHRDLITMLGQTVVYASNTTESTD